MFHKTSQNVLVSVMPAFLDDRSNPAESIYFWAYRVTIKNNRDEAIQILRRKWQITDGEGKLEIVEGDGVVGETPIIRPNEFYEYTSGCQLTTNSGIMVGEYYAQENDQQLIISIPAFSLDLPDNNPVFN